jgi:hypothetical protein
MGLISNKAKTSAGKLFGVNRIYGADGDHETPYMTRAWFGRLRFHVFHRGDADPDCHDHPWGFWTFPLRSYVEEVLEERTRTVWRREAKTVQTYFERRVQVVKAFRLHYRPATHKHRVLGALRGYLSPASGRAPLYAPIGNIPTIVWREKPSRFWGFTKERSGHWCWTPWTTYVFEGGKTAPCEDE